jgi:hypothetical protein
LVSSASPCSSGRYTMATSAPSRAKCTATARPMPLSPPVMRAAWGLVGGGGVRKGGRGQAQGISREGDGGGQTGGRHTSTMDVLRWTTARPCTCPALGSTQACVMNQ